MKFVTIVAVIITISASLETDFYAQTRAPSSAQQVPSLLASLPESDGVAQVKVNRLLNEVMPRVLASSPGKLAEANANIEPVKSRTGIDARALEQLALRIRY